MGHVMVVENEMRLPYLDFVNVIVVFQTLSPAAQAASGTGGQ